MYRYTDICYVSKVHNAALCGGIPEKIRDWSRADTAAAEMQGCSTE